MQRRVAVTLQRFEQVDLKLCRCLNRSMDFPSVRQFFRGIGWLGNGWLWYALIACLPWLYGRSGTFTAMQMLATGFAGVVFYKMIKQRAVRERPFVTHSTTIYCASVPMDRYSFPSGHTLHAVSFTLLMAHAFPEWAVPLAAFTGLVALSRIVLGLHYPTDVAAGAILGAGLAALSVLIA